MSEARVEVSPVVSGYRVTVEVAAGPDDGRVREVWLNEDECLLFFRRRGRRPDADAPAGPWPEGEPEPTSPASGRRPNRVTVDILAHLRDAPDSCWTDVIAAMEGLGHSRRTAARWLTWMQENEWVAAAGAGQSRRYRNTLDD